MPSANLDDVSKVTKLVSEKLDLEKAELGSEFFPAHLPVALIDAVFTPQLKYDKFVVPIVERYCRKFDLQRERVDRAGLPPVNAQLTLRDLLDQYESLGPNRMQDEIFRGRFKSPGTNILKSTNVRYAAIELRKIGIDTLQDVQVKTPYEIKCALLPLSGIGDRTVNMFLMYTGRDDFVKGDVHVCRFVENALKEPRVSPARAEELVKAAAQHLGMAARLLDYEIWKFGSGS